jgi:hypothetical protein
MTAPSKISNQLAAHIRGFAAQGGQGLADCMVGSARRIDEVFRPETLLRS